ncbi:MAG: alpha/beta hydrolase [Leptospiraceae bacterium]|nr:alpha/beta hydrolase [Leptospiraceae bacterium]
MLPEVTHNYFNVNGIRLHVASAGRPDGVPVVLCHGFPELWYSWRHQIEPLAAAGYHVLVPDMRGYGESSSPPEIEAYTHEIICNDLIALLDELGYAQAIFIGHDWGGAIVWSLAAHFPDRVRAVAGINTPHAPAPRSNPFELLKRRPGRYAYQVYFQEPGVAEAELERDFERTFQLAIRSSRDTGPSNPIYRTHLALEAGAFLPDDAEYTPSDLLTEADVAYYAEQYRRTGFRGPLNWYRNMEANWQWARKTDGQISAPALMVTVGRDPVLPASMSKDMEKYVPDLKRGHIEECGHWTMQEKPAELNQILIDWLAQVVSA